MADVDSNKLPPDSSGEQASEPAASGDEIGEPKERKSAHQHRRQIDNISHWCVPVDQAGDMDPLRPHIPFTDDFGNRYLCFPEDPYPGRRYDQGGRKYRDFVD